MHTVEEGLVAASHPTLEMLGVRELMLVLGLETAKPMSMMVESTRRSSS